MNAVPVRANVTLDGGSWEVQHGAALRFGRALSCDIRIGRAEDGPEDDGVSRHAGQIWIEGGRVRVRNDSTINELELYPAAGPGLILAPASEMAPGAARFLVVLVGNVRRYEILVESAGPTSETAPATSDVSPRTSTRIDLRTARERQIVAVFCERLLLGGDLDRTPLSYREAAPKLGVTKKYLENKMLELCNRHFALGLPGMGTPEAKDNLCLRAFRASAVTVADLPAASDEGATDDNG